MSFPSGKAPERKSNFKKTLDAEEIRRRRSETTVQIRKTIKEDRMNQRRRMVCGYYDDGQCATWLVVTNCFIV